MKKMNKKGFTLVELVVVIAVIAILAGVLIATFASVIKKANDSAQIQRTKSEEIAQKADDIMKKIEDSHWYGWEDFENDIVAKITETFKDKIDTSLTVTELEETVTKALEEYAKSHANDKTGLTEDQVKAIIENALGTLKYEGVTEAQVRAIVNAAMDGVKGTQLTAAQVRSIVNAANAQNLTQADVALIIAQADLASATSLQQLTTDIEAAITGATANMLSQEDIVRVIIELLPVTVTADSVGDVDSENTFVWYVQNVNCGSTIIIGDGLSDKDLRVDLLTGPKHDKTLYIKGTSSYTGTLTINAPDSDIGLVGDFSNATIVVEAIKDNSLHVYGNVGSLTINKGRAVVEDSGVVDTLKAAPSVDADVYVVIEEYGYVRYLDAQYQDHKNDVGYDPSGDTITVENNGNVGNAQITASTQLLEGNGVTTTNIKFINKRGSTGTEATEINANAMENATDNQAIINFELVVDTNGEEKTYIVTNDGTKNDLAEADACTHIGYLIGTFCNKCKHPVAFVDEIDDFTTNDPFNQKMPIVEIDNILSANDSENKLYLDVTYSFKAFPNGTTYDDLDNTTHYRLDTTTFTFVEDSEGAFTAKDIFDFFSTWYCDYYVSFSDPVEMNSCGLGGYYGSWGYAVGFLAPQQIPGGYEIPLLGYMTSGGESNWTYNDIANNVGEFKCGFFNLDDKNYNKTFTVKLRMLNPFTDDHSSLTGVECNIGEIDLVLPSYIDVAVTKYVITTPSAENIALYGNGTWPSQE